MVHQQGRVQKPVCTSDPELAAGNEKIDHNNFVHICGQVTSNNSDIYWLGNKMLTSANQVVTNMLLLLHEDDAIYKEHGSLWPQQVSAMATT